MHSTQEESAAEEEPNAPSLTPEVQSELSALRRLLVLVCRKANATPEEIDEACRGPTSE